MLPTAIELKYFNEVANSLSLTKAAMKLNVSQPSLSLAIKRLENSLKLKLFIRHKQGMSLTPAGEVLLTHVQTLLTYWQNTYFAMKDRHDDIQGEINLSCNETVIPYIKNTISQLINRHPKLQINIQHAMTSEIMKAISIGKTDIGIVYDPESYPDMVLSKIVSSEFCLYVSKEFTQQVDLSEDDFTLIGDFNIHYSNSMLQRLNENRKTPLKISKANQTTIVANLTQSGCGVGILPMNLVQLGYKDQLVKLANSPSIPFTMYFAYRPENKVIVAHQIVLSELKKLITEIVN